jgi:ubiquitin-activating enzyme E1
MVGAGALGCEYIKNFCLMGISCKRGKITITDNDNISLSNLNRQFLFHKNDVKEKSSKSFCAKREALKINKNMNIQDYPLLINNDTRDIFSDEFIENQDILVSAVDNLKARQYIDDLSTFFNKIYINSGTEGTKANSDIYYPNKSICMNDLTFEEKKEIPMCTLKIYPTKIEHCIEFSKTVFNELFVQSIANIKIILEDEQQFYNALDETSDREELYLILNIYKNIFYILENPSQYLIIKYAIFIFTYYFEYIINKILREHATSYSNITFNKSPSPIKVDLTDNNVLLYFKSFYHIFSDIINFNEELDMEIIKREISREKIYISEEFTDHQKQIDNFNEEISSLKNDNKIKDKINSMKQIDFDKENDENYHINFILSFSNLRANNYNIEKTEFLNAKEIAGNIIPAIASTTAAITGITCLQIYTLLQTDNLRSFRNSDFNLGTSLFDLYIPEEKRYIRDYINNKNILEKKAIPGEYTIWDKIDIVGPNKTVRNFVDVFKEKYNIDIDYINYGNYTLASPIDGDEDELDKTIEELLKETTKLHENAKYIKLEISGSYEDVEVSTPAIRYIIKNE